MTRVKLCGLTSQADLEAAADAGADLAGLLVLAPESHRDLDVDQARRLAETAPDALDVALVTPTDDPDALHAAVEATRPDVVQATGSVPDEALAEAREDHGVALWRGLRPERQVDATLERVRGALSTCQAVVLDALTDGYGGKGDTLDWTHAAQVTRLAPEASIVLAGGLTPDNVAEAIDTVAPWAVDVSSGIETDEANDPDKMRAFTRAAKEAAP